MNLLSSFALPLAVAAVAILVWKLVHVSRKLRESKRYIRKLDGDRKRNLNEVVDLSEKLLAYESPMIQSPGGLAARIGDCRDVAQALYRVAPHAFAADPEILERLEAIDALLTDLNVQRPHVAVDLRPDPPASAAGPGRAPSKPGAGRLKL